jgi:hypothetical protein
MDALGACCLDEESRAALRVNKDIEREIERWKRDNSKEYKLLLLGELFYMDTPKWPFFTFHLTLLLIAVEVSYFRLKTLQKYL